MEHTRESGEDTEGGCQLFFFFVVGLCFFLLLCCFFVFCGGENVQIYLGR